MHPTRFALLVFVASSALVASVAAQEPCATVIHEPGAPIPPPLIVPDGVIFTGPGETLYIPMYLHVCRTAAGLHGIDEGALAQAVNQANLALSQLGIQVCHVGEIDYIDDDRFCPLTVPFMTNVLRQTNDVPGVMNVYFTLTYLYCGISSFTFSPVQGIVMSNVCVGPGDPSTFAHEIGHYFDLFHTHETTYGKECVSGVNCSYAGDLICDTPADPQLTGQTVDLNCNYTGNTPGPCPDDPPYAPDTDNYMSYSRPLCRDRFTPLQAQRARIIATTLRAGLLRTACPRSCTGDLNFDDVVDVADLGLLIASYGHTTGSLDFNAAADIDRDGVVDQADLGILLAALGRPCK
jgi:hypothetical protein